MDKRAEARINLKAIRDNAAGIRARLGGHCRLIAVVKADAYGHGALPVSRALAEDGVTDFAVATADEGEELRKGGISGNILVLGKTPPAERDKLVSNGLQQCCDSLEYAQSIVKDGKPALQIKIDTGMSRLGFYCHSAADAESCARRILPVYAIEGVDIRGIFTHFAAADGESDDFTRRQFRAFTAVTEALKAKGARLGTRHCCNSAAALRFPEMQLDAVRVGIGLYGLERSVKDFPYRPAMSLFARLAAVGEIREGDTVSYDRTFKAARDMSRGIVSIGYADGMPRLLSGRYSVAINGRKAPILGRICMDMFAVDLSGIDCREGDEVRIFGEGGEVSEMADLIGTINYEIVCGISKRVPRTYFEK